MKEWLPTNEIKEIKLVYRASHDGWNAIDF